MSTSNGVSVQSEKMNCILVLVLGSVFSPCIFAKVYVSSDDLYQIVDLNTQHLTSVIFAMKGPRLAHIGLAPTTKTSGGTRMYEFVIEIGNPSTVWLRAKSGANIVKTGDFDNSLLNNNEFNKFWISWTDGMIEFGTGWTIGEEKLLSHSDALNMKVNYFVVRALNRITVSYDIPEAIVTNHESCLEAKAIPLSDPDIQTVLFDNDTSTCVKINWSVGFATSVSFLIQATGTSLQFSVSNMESCREPYVTVYSPKCMRQLPLVNSDDVNGTLQCQYQLTGDCCQPIVTLRFNDYMQKEEDWRLCDVRVIK